MTKKKTVYGLLFLTLPTLVVVAAVLALMNWRIPTHVQIELTVDRVVFTLGGTGAASTPILKSVRFQSITVEKFARIELEPEKLDVADPSEYILADNRYLAWKSLTITPPVVITAKDETLQPAVTLESARDTAGSLDKVWAMPGAVVTLEVRGSRTEDLTVKLDQEESSIGLSFSGPFQLITDYCRISGISKLPYSADSLTYRAELPNRNSRVKITGQPGSLILILKILPEKVIDLFYKDGIPVTALDFTHLDETGKVSTTLVKDKAGEIIYPDYLKVEKVFFKAPDYISLDQLDKFQIEEIALDTEHKGIKLRLNGITGRLRTGSREFPKDQRLTLFDTFWQDSRLVILFSIIVWVLPTTVGGYRLYKEI